jgi:hypothetical protein
MRLRCEVLRPISLSNSRSVRIFDSLLAPGIFASPVPPARRALHLLDPTDASKAEYVNAHGSSLCRIPQPGSRPRNTRFTSMMRAPASAAENPAKVSPTPALTAPGSRSRTFSRGSGRLLSRRPGLMSGSVRLRMGTSRPPVGMPGAASNTATIHGSGRCERVPSTNTWSHLPGPCPCPGKSCCNTSMRRAIPRT